MARSVWKGPFVHPSLLKKIDKLKDVPNKKPIKTWSRHSTLIPLAFNLIVDCIALFMALL